MNKATRKKTAKKRPEKTISLWISYLNVYAVDRRSPPGFRLYGYWEREHVVDSKGRFVRMGPERFVKAPKGATE